MGKYKFLGTVSKDVVEQWNIPDQLNKPIVIFADREKHAKERHINDFGGLEVYNHVKDSLDKVIKHPDYVFYDQSKKGLEYYKNISPNVVVAVRVDTGKILKVRSFYPVTEQKIKNRRKKQDDIEMANLIEKYRHKDEFFTNI